MTMENVGAKTITIMFIYPSRMIEIDAEDGE